MGRDDGGNVGFKLHMTNSDFHMEMLLSLRKTDVFQVREIHLLKYVYHKEIQAKGFGLVG